ncbi:MAG: hypothetical protein WBB82_10430 [Limnothrix sp.]
MITDRSLQRVLELAEDIYIETAIPRENHPAVRSGFAGYPSNPRWNVRKHQAWKQGKQWRLAHEQGLMIVEKKQLILAEQAEPKPVVQQEEKSSWRSPFKKLTFSLN